MRAGAGRRAASADLPKPVAQGAGPIELPSPLTALGHPEIAELGQRFRRLGAVQPHLGADGEGFRALGEVGRDAASPSGLRALAAALVGFPIASLNFRPFNRLGGNVTGPLGGWQPVRADRGDGVWGGGYRGVWGARGRGR